jgi:hypothetical protein
MGRLSLLRRYLLTKLIGDNKIDWDEASINNIIFIQNYI